MSISPDVAVSVEHVSKRYRLYRERNDSLKAVVMRGRRAKYTEFQALDDISFEVPRGSTFGLVGENGSGKSTLLKCMARILVPETGTITTRGTVAALLELGSGFHPELSGRENVYLNASILGLSKKDVDRIFDDIVEFAGVGRFIDQPVKNYSSGMYVRLGFSVAVNVEPEILLVDEVLAVGDSAFQRKCMEKFAQYRQDGRTVVVVSHDTGTMRTFCDEVARLEDGQLVAIGPPSEVVDTYEDESRVERVDAGAHEDASARWGRGDATITSVQLLGPGGTPTSKVRTGDRVTVRIHWAAEQPVPKPVFGLALETLDGHYLWAHHSRDGRAVADEISGSGHVDLVVDGLMLQPGTFDLSASVNAFDCVTVFDYRRRVVRLDVEHGTPTESGGPVALGGRWGLPVEDGAAPVPRTA